MEISGNEIANIFYSHLKQEIADFVKERGVQPPKLVIFTVKPSQETKSYVRAKRNACEKIGADFDVVKFNSAPRFQTFVQQISEVSQSPKTSGIVIQHPLPPSLATMSLYDYVPDEKEIEGFKPKVEFEPPIGLAVLSILKKIFSPHTNIDYNDLNIDLDKDTQFFKSTFKRRRVVLMGRGRTAGKPIGEILSKAKINYINLNSQTSTAEMFIKQADVIITAVGKDVIKPEWLKNDVSLISIGMRKEGRFWKGDYNEAKIKDTALAYTPTPGGVGPVNVAYLLNNLVKAWKIQNKLVEQY